MAYEKLLNKSVANETEYRTPYMGRRSKRCFMAPKVETYKVVDYKSIYDPNSKPIPDLMMKYLVTKGPLAIAIGVYGIKLQHYKKGIFSATQACKNKDVNHAVTLVGE